MTTTHAIRLLITASLLSLPAVASAAPACPAAVTDAAKKAFPDASVTKCVAEKSVYEVKMLKKDKSKVELDITASGEIEQIEELVPVASLPEAVTKAFAAKYGKAAILRAEKQTKSDKTVTFEVAFKVGKAVKEATFKDDGTFVEEE